MNILETDRPADSTVPALYDSLVDLNYGGVDPGPCSNPGIIKCPNTGSHICSSSRGYAEGICKSFNLSPLFSSKLAYISWYRTGCKVVTDN